MEIIYLKNKQTGVEYTLTAYARKFTDLVYTDVECVAKSIDEDDYYLLDQCGNYSVINTRNWEIVSVDEEIYRQKRLNKEIL